MKKEFLVCLFILFMGGLFANSITLEADRSNGNEITMHGYEAFQTVRTDSGVIFTVGAQQTGSSIRYDVEVKNPSKERFYFNVNSVRLYEGNKNTGHWTKVKTDTMPVTETVSSSDDDMTLAEGLVAAALVGTVLVGGIILFDLIFGKDDPPTIDWDNIKKDPKPLPEYHNPPARRRPYYHHYHDHDIIDDILFWEFIDDHHSNNNVVRYENEAMTSKTIRKGQMYYGSVYAKAGHAKDYKFCYEMPNGEVVEMIFSSTEENTYDEFFPNIAGSANSTNNSFGVTSASDSSIFDNSKIAVIGAWDIIHHDNAGGYIAYLTDSIGCYFGANFGYGSLGIYECDGYSNTRDYSDVEMNSEIKNHQTQYKFVPDDSYEAQRSYLNFTLGLTSKIAPCTWLMAGCGVDLSTQTKYGTFYSKNRDEPNSSYTYCKNGMLYDKTYEFLVTPELGINFAFSIFDIGAMFRYTTKVGPELNLMAGFAF